MENESNSIESLPKKPPPPRQRPQNPDLSNNQNLSISSLAIASLVLGATSNLTAILFFPIASAHALIGIILGGVAVSKINQNRHKGKELANAGIILSIIALATTAIMLVLVLNNAGSFE